MDDELLTPKSKVHEQLKHLQNNKEINLVGFQVIRLDRKRLTEWFKCIRE